MASERDEAFEAFYRDLTDRGCDTRDRDMMRVAWDAGRRYEAERRDELARAAFKFQPFTR